MKSILFFITLFTVNKSIAQDYFVIQATDSRSFRYPASARLITSTDGCSEQPAQLPATIPAGGYAKVYVTWRQQPELIRAKNGSIHISRVSDMDSLGAFGKRVPLQEKHGDESKPKLLKTITTASTLIKGAYNVQLIFSDNFWVNYEDGKVSAGKNGEVLPITGKYLVKLKEGLFKFSFDALTGVCWYVFEYL